MCHPAGLLTYSLIVCVAGPESIHICCPKGRTIDDWGGLGQKRGENKTQLDNPKKTQLNNLEEKKNHYELYAGLRCPEHRHTCLLHTI